ncbi:MAG: YkgJ family cysteine cluster protein [Dehalococcoidia bacterium]
MPSQQGADEVRRFVRRRYPAYAAVLPGDPSFICVPDDCGSRCCRTLTVPVGERDVLRIERRAGLSPETFLECERGEPVALPLRDPYVLARRGPACTLLKRDGSCRIYDSRPAACRSYPFDAAVRSDDASEELLPEGGTRRIRGPLVLLRHLECPGFIGEPLRGEAWETLLEKIGAARGLC